MFYFTINFNSTQTRFYHSKTLKTASATQNERQLISQQNRNKTNATNRLFGGEERVAQPPPRRAVPADVRERAVVVAVGGAERHLFDGLVEQQRLGGIFDDPQSVRSYVQHGLYFLFLALCKKCYLFLPFSDRLPHKQQLSFIFKWAIFDTDFGNFQTMYFLKIDTYQTYNHKRMIK